ncbi:MULTISPECIES: hypothetical protein [unclassified Curtobacterium]|uniref:hypothetical protein n=1 Tax=unclassified Curtobacterium TaxID=257496 RepID=UPI00226BB01D|nr:MULTISPECIES: hypothetical protein [unclassified Curtobacterium]
MSPTAVAPFAGARRAGRTAPVWLARTADVVLPVVVGLLAAAIAWCRLPAGARDTLWAEDAAVFLTQRLQLGPFASLVHPYDGYQHLVPRLVAEVAAALPAESYARTVTALCCVVVGLVAAATMVFARGTIRTTAVRAVFALVPALTPVVAFEVLGNSANLHSFLLFLTPVLLLVRPRTWTGAVAPAVIAFVVAVSEIQAVYFVPMLVLVLAWRNRRAWPIGGALLLGLGLQLLSVLSSSRVRTPMHQDPSDVVTGWFLEPVLSTLYPKASSAAVRLAQVGFGLAVVLALVFVAAAAVVLVGRWRRGDGLGRLRALTIALLVGSPLVWAAGVVLNPTPLIDFSEHGITFLGQTGYVRYAAPASMFLIGLVVLAAERLVRVGRTVTTIVAAVVLIGVCGGLALRAAPSDVARSGAPTWSAEFRHGERDCDGGAADSRLEQAPWGWGVTLACSTIQDDTFPTDPR